MRINAGDTAWVLASAALVHVHDAGAGAVLRRHGAGQERARDAHAELHLPGPHQRALGRVHVLARVQRHRQVDRRTSISRSSTARTPPRRPASASYPIPPLSFSAFQMMFAIITPALITGAIADRMRFSAWVWFVGLWALRRVHADRALGVLAGRVAVPPGRARLRRRHRRAHQRAASRRWSRCW